MTQSHWLDLNSLKPQILRDGGSRLDIRADQLTSLHRFALSVLTLQPKGFREPHWHSNANEVGYCVEGKGAVTIFSPNNGHDTFTIEAGDLIFIPRSFLHYIENTGNVPLTLLEGFDHERADSNELSNAFHACTADILATTFHQPSSFFTSLKKGSESVVIGVKEKPISLPFPSIPNRYKFGLERNNPQIQTPGGYVKLVNQGMMPVLDGLTAYILELNEKGLREPHWHPNAYELNYCLSGNVRIMLQFPEGATQTFELSAGGISLMPRGYFHYIENIGPGPARLIIFFNHESPSDIGLSGGTGAFSNELLSSLFGVADNYFEGFPKYQKDLKIVAGGG